VFFFFFFTCKQLSEVFGPIIATVFSFFFYFFFFLFLYSLSSFRGLCGRRGLFPDEPRAALARASRARELLLCGCLAHDFAAALDLARVVVRAAGLAQRSEHRLCAGPRWLDTKHIYIKHRYKTHLLKTRLAVTNPSEVRAEGNKTREKKQKKKKSNSHQLATQPSARHTTKPKQNKTKTKTKQNKTKQSKIKRSLHHGTLRDFGGVARRQRDREPPRELRAHPRGVLEAPRRMRPRCVRRQPLDKHTPPPPAASTFVFILGFAVAGIKKKETVSIVLGLRSNDKRIVGFPRRALRRNTV
jgi:hypothetical protein